MPNTNVLLFVKELPKPVEYDFGDGIILRYYKVDEMDPILDQLSHNLLNSMHMYRKAWNILREHKLDHLLDL